MEAHQTLERHWMALSTEDVVALAMEIKPVSGLSKVLYAYLSRCCKSAIDDPSRVEYPELCVGGLSKTELAAAMYATTGLLRICADNKRQFNLASEIHHQLVLEICARLTSKELTNATTHDR